MDIELKLKESEEILRYVQGLKENESYQGFKRMVLDPGIESVEKRIESNMKDLVKDTTGEVRNMILQDQGMIAAYKRFADLDALENRIKVEQHGLRTIYAKKESGG